MRLRVLALLAVLGLALGLTAPARAADKPTLVVRVNSLETMVSDFVYLGKLAGREDEAKQVEGLFKAMVGPKGLEGFDPKKPIGMYARMGADIADSDAVFFVPVADDGAVIDLLDRQGIPYKKQQDGVYEITLPNSPVPGYFRFANGYAYITAANPKFIDPKNALKPSDILGKFDGLMSMTVNLDTIPEQTREMMLGQLELQLEQAKEEAPGGETEAQKKLRLASIDAMFGQLKQVVTNGKTLNIDIGLDRKSDEISFSVTFDGKKGSPLSKSIADLGTLKSLGAALMNDNAALSDYVRLSLPKEMLKQVGAAYDEMAKQAVAKTETEAQRKVATKILDALGATVKSGVLDAGGQLRGPDANGKYTIVAGMAIEDGADLEKAVKDLVAQIPDREREKVNIKLDCDKIDGVNVHSVTIPDENQETERAKKLLGDLTIYLAFRNDAVFMTLGSQAKSAMKAAIATKPAESKVLGGEISVGKFLAMVPEEQNGETVRRIGNEVFGKEAKDDKITWSLTGGEEMKLKVTMKGKLIEFFAKVGMAQREF